MRLRHAGTTVEMMVETDTPTGKARVHVVLPWHEARTFFKAGLDASVQAERVAKFGPLSFEAPQ